MDIALQVFRANVDSYSVEHVYLPSPIEARFVKIHVQSWNRHPSMRIELIGCQGMYYHNNTAMKSTT